MSMRDLVPWGRQSSSAPAPYRAGEPSPLHSFRNEMDRLFDDFFRGMPAFGLGRAMAWPSIEVSDRDGEVGITAELSGMSEKDIELTLEDGMLTIRGEKKSETGDADRGWSERYYGRLERRVVLPGDVDEERASATFRDGILTVTLPRTGGGERGRRIPINGETRH